MKKPMRDMTDLDQMLAKAHRSKTAGELSPGLLHRIMADVRAASRPIAARESILDKLERLFAPSLTAAAVTIAAAVVLWMDLSGSLGPILLTLAGLLPEDLISAGLHVP